MMFSGTILWCYQGKLRYYPSNVVLILLHAELIKPLKEYEVVHWPLKWHFQDAVCGTVLSKRCGSFTSREIEHV